MSVAEKPELGDWINSDPDEFKSKFVQTLVSFSILKLKIFVFLMKFIVCRLETFFFA